jgi:putative redox protein
MGNIFLNIQLSLLHKYINLNAEIITLFMKVSKIIYVGNLRTEATHLRSGQTIITDAPPDNNGKGEAFSPTDLMATSLGSCMLTIMGIAAEKHAINIEGTSLDITKIMQNDPRRVSEIIVEFSMPKRDFTEKEKLILERAAHTCPVALSLNKDLKQTVVFNY